MENTSNKVKKGKIRKYPIKLINSFYSNAIGYRFKEEECYIEFFQTPATDEGNFLGIRIYSTPSTLKFFRDNIDKAVKGYEKAYGKIKKEETKNTTISTLLNSTEPSS